MLADVVGRPSSPISRALTWRQKTPTAVTEKTRFTAGMRTASKRSRQLSASSSASSRASDGARVWARCRGGRTDIDHEGCVFIGRRRAAQHNYSGAPSGSHLRDTWHACNSLKVVPCSHACLDCRVVVTASSVFRQSGYGIKNRFKLLSLCLLLTRIQRRQSTGFNRMHMIWIDRIWGRSTEEFRVRSHSLRSRKIQMWRHSYNWML